MAARMFQNNAPKPFYHQPNGDGTYHGAGKINQEEIFFKGNSIPQSGNYTRHFVSDRCCEEPATHH